MDTDAPDDGDLLPRGKFAAVVVLEVLVITALWVMSQYFSS